MADYSTYCAAVSDEVARIGAVARAHDRTTPVPTCPDWTLADLVRHVGLLQQWFAAMISRRSPARLEFKEVDFGLPADPADYPDWLLSRHVSVAETLRSADPDAAMWTWGPGGTVRFWARRMLMECLVHRCDAELAVGSLTAVDPALAVDGVAEFLVNLPSAEAFAPGVAGLRGDGQTIGFSAPGGEWTVRLDPESFGLVPTGSPDATVAAATPEALLLLVYGRIGAEDTRITTAGDADLLAKWFEHSKF
jgi:uncharacterized protein (TIGR03083 family)